MTRLLPHFALLAVLLGAWFTRAELASERTLIAAGPYAAFDDPESSYRLRATELTLATGRAPRVDSFLGGGAAAPIPFPPLVHASLALVAAHTLGDEGRARELNGVDEAALEQFAARVSPLLGVLAVGLAFVLCAWLARGPRAAWGGIAAAALIAFTPAAIASESASSLRAQPWIEILALAELAALAVALRAREQIDVTLGALLAGLFSGLSLLAGVEAWPLSLAALAVLFALMARVPRAKKREAWRAAVLFLVVNSMVIALAEPVGAFALAAPHLTNGIDLERVAYSNAAFPLAWWLLFQRRRDALHAVLLSAGFLAYACALFDPRFQACLQVIFATSLAIVVADQEPTPRASSRSAVLGVLALATIVIAFTPWLAPREPQGALRREFVEGLRWLRTNSASPGPFNSSDAPQDWRVWTAPELAGSVAYHARRPLVGATIAGTRSGRELDAGDDEFLTELDNLDALYVVATPCMARDDSVAGGRALDPSSSIAVFMRGEASSAPAGWLLVHATPTRITPAASAPVGDEFAGPLLSIWRRTSRASETGPGASER